MKGEVMHCAVVYDFDGTLSQGNCAEHGLMESIGITDVGEFWNEVKRKNQKRDGDEILTYLGELALRARESKAQDQLSVQNLRMHGASIPLFPGVENWFDEINRFASDQGIALSHYIISSGLEEMIRGTAIADEFKEIFGCRYHYDKDSQDAKWPALAINYTTKTQYLFRINKGVENSWDDDTINQYVEPKNRMFPFDHMIYLGDGDTDIPSMKLVKEQGGCSLAVFDPDKWKQPRTREKIEKLISENRVNYVVAGNYQTGSQLDVTIRGILRLYNRNR